jgi:DNA-directed RNA polymerase specialized sigma24 family protein
MAGLLVTEMMSKPALSPLVAAYADAYDELVGYVRARVGCSATAADIVQETYLRATASPQQDSLANPRAFLYRVAGNLALDHSASCARAPNTSSTGLCSSSTTRLFRRQCADRLSA